MDDLNSRLRAYIAQREKIRDGGDTVTECNGEPLTLTDLREAANAIEEAQMGLRYAVQVWVLADEIEWSEAEIDEAVERIIGYAKKEARNG